VKEAKFIDRNKDKWARMEQLQGLDADQLAVNFVNLSDDLSYAKTFYPGSKVVDYLNKLITSYQINIYSRQGIRQKGMLSFWIEELPALFYREKRTLGFAFIFFGLACVVGAFSAFRNGDFVRLIMGDAYVNETLKNIADGTPMGIYASTGAWEMFFGITLNNIKVSFLAFAMGILFSAGTLWVLFSNGVMLGAFLCFFFEQGLGLHASLSVWAHGTFEITSIILAGGAGLVMGNSSLFPGTYGRVYSFRQGALRGIKIVVGLIPFFVVAGAIESFVTRHADAHPFVGACAILFSLVGVVAYFVGYPYYLHKNEFYGKN